MNNLRAKYAAAIEAAIAKAKTSRELRTVEAFDGAECDAYPKPHSGIAWGVNAVGTGVNILRGTRLPDGSDEGVI